MPQKIKMAITTHTTMIVTFDESLLCFSAAPVGGIEVEVSFVSVITVTVEI